MPELPEVETIVRGLGACLPGRRITRAVFRQPRVLLTPAPQMSRALAGATVTAVERFGKHIVLRMTGRSGPFCFLAHLGMTGQLVCEARSRRPRPHTHAWLELADHGEVLRYTDIRQFGRLEIAPGLPPRLARLGPDPLAIDEEEFARLLRARSARVKALLLDQHFLRGLGNIYADEALFRAGVRPAAPGSRISRPRVSALWHSIRSVLQEAIAHGGSSVSDYVNAGGRAGAFQNLHRVYGRAGQACLSCGARLRRALVAGRGTTFCPRCQRR